METRTPRKPIALRKIFLSYARKNRKFARRLTADLEKAGVKNVWRDEKSIEGGADWEEAIKKGIRDCRDFLLVLSPQSVDSEWVRDEIHYARKQGKRIIPLLLRKCDETPLALERIEHIDFTYYKRGLAELLDLPAPPIRLPDIVRRFLREKGVWLATVIFATLMGIAGWYYLPPSSTSLTVAGIKEPKEKDSATGRKLVGIVVHVANSGGRPAKLTGGYRLKVPTLPIYEQNLRPVEDSSSSIPGHDDVEIGLISRPGLRSMTGHDGFKFTAGNIGEHLPGHLAILEVDVEESSGRHTIRYARFAADRILPFFVNSLPNPRRKR